MEKYTLQQIMKDAAMLFYIKVNKYDKEVVTPLLLQTLLTEAVNDTLTMSAVSCASETWEDLKQRRETECI